MFTRIFLLFAIAGLAPAMCEVSGSTQGGDATTQPSHSTPTPSPVPPNMSTSTLSPIDSAILTEYDKEAQSVFRTECNALLQQSEITLARMREAYVTIGYRINDDDYPPDITMLLPSIDEDFCKLLLLRQTIATSHFSRIERLVAEIVSLNDHVDTLYAHLWLWSEPSRNESLVERARLPIIRETPDRSDAADDRSGLACMMEYDPRKHPVVPGVSMSPSVHSYVRDVIATQLTRLHQSIVDLEDGSTHTMVARVAARVCARMIAHMNTFAATGLLVARAEQAVITKA